ncbi:hypothetical protein [Phenylobacterium sp.]|uniref:hypothetical protein n=1 Tax=Phenylobacterium sp. TaxID=1871053 RepID=UPI00271CDF25|nr:hypothetical protein [Phenylobacterium sp.]MDO8380740.1 hypothetical protein [Phenylobacterium sp.]
MPRRSLDLTADDVVRGLLIAGFLVMLAGAMPGHLSPDSISQLYEGRMGTRETWGPAAYASVLAIFDSIVPGTGLYLVASGFILFASLLGLRGLRPRASWAAVPVTLLMVASPAILVFQGIVWKDVLFANLAIGGFFLLARASVSWPARRPPWIVLAGALLALALAAQVRQNGIIVAPFAALAVAWTVRGEGWRRGLAWGLGSLVAIVAASHLIGVAAQPAKAGPDKASGVGVRILEHYDIIGAVAHDPTLQLSVFNTADPEAQTVIRARGAPLYSPVRIDYLDADPAVGAVLWRQSDQVVRDQWLDIVLHHPRAYLAHRLDVFRWVFLTPRIDSCLPLFVGVEGPADSLKKLEIAVGKDASDRAIYNYGTWFLDGPLFSHLSYALTALLTAGALLLRRDRADMVMVAMLAASLAFTGSFLAISIACDYRYLYFLDLAALTGLLYLALDPPVAQVRRLLRR